MLYFRLFGVALSLGVLAACSNGGGAAPPAGRGSSSGASSAALPLPPSASVARLRRTSAPNVASSFPDLREASRAFHVGSLAPKSTVLRGDVGFHAGDAIVPNATAIFAIMTAYTTTQYALPFPPSGSPTAPARPERFFGPEMSPGPSCLLMGVLYANFGPGGTQRNGPGDPLQFEVGPYNALRVVDFCNAPPNQPATFYLTPIDTTFVANYVRPNQYGLPSIAGEIASPEGPGAVNAHWYALLYNFNDQEWDVMTSTSGTTPAGSPGDVIAYPGTRNLPEVCPSLPPLVAQDIAIYDPTNEQFRKANQDNSERVFPGTSLDPFTGAPSSNACFVADATGPASLDFAFVRAEQNSDWVLQSAATPALSPQP